MPTRVVFLSSRSLVVRALIENPDLINWWLTFKAFTGLIALLCGNGYIVGINQIFDVGIDKYDLLQIYQLSSYFILTN